MEWNSAKDHSGCVQVHEDNILTETLVWLVETLDIYCDGKTRFRSIKKGSLIISVNIEEEEYVQYSYPYPILLSIVFV